MPRGWYLAQGLVPLGYSSSDDEEGPVTLPNGKIVCGPHGLEWCPRCCMDFTDLNEDIDDENNDDNDEDDEDDNDSYDDDVEEVQNRLNEVFSGSSGSSNSSGTRPCARALAVSSLPSLRRLRLQSSLWSCSPVAEPGCALSGKLRQTSSMSELLISSTLARLTLPNDTLTGLILTDGACLDNGQANPKAAWAFVDGLGPTGELRATAMRLEQEGPFGAPGLQTSNRAELRAVIAALRLRFWPGEGFRKLVIATDSEYVVEGSTQWAKGWMKNGWTTKSRASVKNRDLWEALLGEIERYDAHQMAVEFWRIPREWNTVADSAAKKAAADNDVAKVFTDILGLSI